MIVRFAECCNPIPGDQIIGFLTRGRGIAIHRADCPNAELFEGDKERRIEVNWDDGEHKIYSVLLEITGADRPGLLYDISEVLTEFGVNISAGNIETHNKRAKLSFRVEIRNLNQLKQFFRRLQKIKGIENVARVKDYMT
jgi:GTP pyrophosphokinase